MNDIVIRPFKKGDHKTILAIFNYYAKNGFAVYAEVKFKKPFVEQIVKNTRVLLILEVEGAVAGFGYISPYKPYPNFARTGVLTYFISQEFTGKGYGHRLFEQLVEAGQTKGITNYLAHICSRNEASLKFHQKLGFAEVGRFKHVADKFGELFDIVWVQKDFDGHKVTPHRGPLRGENTA